MEYRELTQLFTKLNETTDEDTISKVMELAVKAKSYMTLQNLLSSQQQPALTKKEIKAERKHRGRQINIGRTFKIPLKEIKVMPDRYKHIFACDDRLVPYRFHKGVYEAHYRRHGLDVFACAKNFEDMKRKFLIKLLNCTDELCLPIQIGRNVRQSQNTRIPFKKYIDEWLKIKKQTVKTSTFKEYERVAKFNIESAFGNYTINQMTRSVIQDYLFSIVNEGKQRTAEKVHLILSCIFDLISEDTGIKSPMKKIVLPYHEAKKGSALTKAEEKTLVDYCIQNKDNAACSALLVLLYFGLRKSELKTIAVKEDHLICTTSKTRMGRNEVKRTIPFTPVFRNVLQCVDFEKAKSTNVNTIQTTFKRLFPAHHVHELRYTFITRAKESGCNPEVVMLWAGHSFDKDVKTSVVDRGYTDYSKEYLTQEAQKINYTI